jgi:hypothetical protein
MRGDGVMSTVMLVLAVAVMTVGSRVAALALLPPPPEFLVDTVQRLPAPLFAALAAHSLVGAGGDFPDPTITVAACCALLAAVRWPSLLIALAAGLGGFVLASLIW